MGFVLADFRAGIDTTGFRALFIRLEMRQLGGQMQCFHIIAVQRHGCVVVVTPD